MPALPSSGLEEASARPPVKNNATIKPVVEGRMRPPKLKAFFQRLS